MRSQQVIGGDQRAGKDVGVDATTVLNYWCLEWASKMYFGAKSQPKSGITAYFQGQLGQKPNQNLKENPLN